MMNGSLFAIPDGRNFLLPLKDSFGLEVTLLPVMIGLTGEKHLKSTNLHMLGRN